MTPDMLLGCGVGMFSLSSSTVIVAISRSDECGGGAGDRVGFVVFV